MSIHDIYRLLENHPLQEGAPHPLEEVISTWVNQDAKALLTIRMVVLLHREYIAANTLRCLARCLGCLGTPVYRQSLVSLAWARGGECKAAAEYTADVWKIQIVKDRLGFEVLAWEMVLAHINELRALRCYLELAPQTSWDMACDAVWSELQHGLTVAQQQHRVEQKIGWHCPGIRDPDNPCTEFIPGQPSGVSGSAFGCESDGHYLCGECENRVVILRFAKEHEE